MEGGEARQKPGLMWVGGQASVEREVDQMRDKKVVKSQDRVLKSNKTRRNDRVV